MVKRHESFWLIAPFATWMVLMAILPPTSGSYAVRMVATALVLILSAGCLMGPSVEPFPCWDVLIGTLVGLGVFFIWVLPEQFDWAWYRRFCIIREGGTQAIAEASVVLIVFRLLGSALVIAVAEELFFRKWLIGFAGFPWMVALFAVEHDRWLVGALAGVVYGVLYLRRGLAASIAAHVTTNLVLGLWVLHSGQWQFW